MVLGQADRPLLDRQLDRLDPQSAVGPEALLLALLAKRERPGIGRVGEEVVHGAIARARPADAALADRSAWQLLAVSDQLHHDLTSGTQLPPQTEHAVDRVADLLVGAEHDAVVLVAVKADRQRQAQFAALSFVAQPAIQPRADQVKLGLRHRALQTQQQPVVEVRR
jgi:hypothetical protein